MKKVNKSVAAPALFAAYYAGNPLDTWESFTQTDQAGKCETQETLRQDQYHLCAYCEIDLLPGCGKGHDDFRVEHFHPKSRPPEPPPNWDLDWTNLLAVFRRLAKRLVARLPIIPATSPREIRYWMDRY